MYPIMSTPTSVRTRNGAAPTDRGVSSHRNPGADARTEPEVKERAVRFGRGSGLVGIVSEPQRARERTTGVILVNAGILHRVGPSRLNVYMARNFARAGFPCLRFDLSGIGDSDPSRDALPFEESSVRDVREAMDFLGANRDLDGFTVVGLCSGADLAYRAALADPRIRAIAPIDGHAYHTWRYHLHRFGPRFFRFGSWWNLVTGRTYIGPWVRGVFSGDRGEPGARGDVEGDIFQRPLPPKEELQGQLQILVDRGVRIFAVFSGGMRGRYNYGSQFRDAFRSVDFHGLLDETFLRDADHTFTNPRRRGVLVDAVTEWALDRRAT